MGKAEAIEVLKQYQVDSLPLMIVGTFEKGGVTVYAQQVRALNLAWALVDGERVRCVDRDASSAAVRGSVAVVGGGFAGLTLAAALIKKNIAADIYVFEQRDTLLPLQHGSDARWLHPRIYDWPAPGSESQVAMLPVLNWTAARASDVVVQVLAEWQDAADAAGNRLHLYCNTRHLQIDSAGARGKLRIEWVGESRSGDEAERAKDGRSHSGETKAFDLVVLAVGFGLEKDNAHSYWRNDVAGQPSLDASRSTYLVSGQGDGAMVDLLRVRVSHFRQDRILEELFQGQSEFFEKLKELRRDHAHGNGNLFERLEGLQHDARCGDQFREVVGRLGARLRRDTDAILHLKVRKFAALFNTPNIRISFQNKVLVYFLYKSGGFFPSTQDIATIACEHRIDKHRIFVRHGTEADAQLRRVLSEKLQRHLKPARKATWVSFPSQPADIAWPGGFFGFEGKTRDAADLGEDVKASWRKEYLPGATELLASSFCAAFAWHLSGVVLPPTRRLRVTLHRTIRVGSDELLQQCCDYAGFHLNESGRVAGRTFPVTMATIGLAYRTRKIVRSAKGVLLEDLDAVMNVLQLNEATRKMASEVSFVAAIPLLEPTGARCFTEPSPVAGVIYVDAMDTGFFLRDDQLATIANIVQDWFRQLERRSAFGHLRNFRYSISEQAAADPEPLPPQVNGVLETVDAVPAPETVGPFQFNYDHSDFLLSSVG